MEDSKSLLAGYPVVTTIPVLWGDEDAFGHVNNLVYLRWCETSRVEYLYRLNLFPALPPSGEGPILASIKCDYEMPLTYPDTVLVGSRIVNIGRSSMRMEHVVVSEKFGKVAARVDSTLVQLDYAAQRPAPISAEVRKRVGEFEGREFL